MERCFECKKKALINFKCKCSNIYCIKCKIPELHQCKFNYKEEQQKILEKLNPHMNGKKLESF